MTKEHWQATAITLAGLWLVTAAAAWHSKRTYASELAVLKQRTESESVWVYSDMPPEEERYTPMSETEHCIGGKVWVDYPGTNAPTPENLRCHKVPASQTRKP